MKGCGKTTVGKLLAKKLNIDFIDSDTEIENLHRKEKGETLTFREIFKKYGEDYFNDLDEKCLKNILKVFNNQSFVFTCAGRTPFRPKNQKLLKTMGKIIYLKPDKEVLYRRIMQNGIPPFFPYQDDPRKSFEELLARRGSIYEKIADTILRCGLKTPNEIIKLI